MHYLNSKLQQIFSVVNFSKYLTTSSYLTYLHVKCSVFSGSIISTNLFLALGMTPNCSNTTLKGCEEICWQAKYLWKAVAIYKINKLAPSKKLCPWKLEARKKYLTQKIAVSDLFSVTNKLNSMFLASIWAMVNTEERTLIA